MKKQYNNPVFEVLTVQTSLILAGSDIPEGTGTPPAANDARFSVFDMFEDNGDI